MPSNRDDVVGGLDKLRSELPGKAIVDLARRMEFVERDPLICRMRLSDGAGPEYHGGYSGIGKRGGVGAVGNAHALAIAGNLTGDITKLFCNRSTVRVV